MKNKKNTGNCKALCVSRKHNKFGWILNGTVEKKTKERKNLTFANNIVHNCHIQANHIMN